jgi:hypothetical protein
MVRFGSIICFILSSQIIIAFYFMLQCYDGNVFSKPNEESLAIKNNDKFFKSEIEENESLKLSINSKNCLYYAQKCFDLFRKFNLTKIRKLKNYKIIRNEVINFWRLNISENDMLRNIFSNYSREIKNKKMLIFPSSKDFFKLEALSLEMNASKILRLDNQKNKIIDSKYIEWLSFNDYFNYLLNMNIIEQYDNSIYLNKNFQIDFFLKMVHCLIKNDGLLFINLPGYIIESNAALNGWINISTNFINNENNLHILRKKTLC